MPRAQVGFIVGRAGPGAQQVFILKQCVHPTQAQAQKHAARKRPAALARQQHIRAGRPFRVGKPPMLFHNQLPPQRDHKQHAQPAAQQRQEEDARILQVEAQKNQRGQCKDNPGGNGLSGIAGSLHNIVFKDGRAAQRTQHRNRQHRNRNGSRDGKPRAQTYIHRDRAEQQAEERTQQQCPCGKLGPLLRRCDIGMKLGRRLRLWHAGQSLSRTEIRKR